MPCPVSGISFTNITQGAGTEVAVLLDFEGLKTNPINGIVIDGVYGDLDILCLLRYHFGPSLTHYPALYQPTHGV